MKSRISNLFVLILGLAFLSSTSGATAQDLHNVLSIDEDNMAEMGYHIDVATLENTIDTSAFYPESPDPAGIAYIEHKDRLLISDSEVNEMPIYKGTNLFETSLKGTLVNIGTTLPHSNEPTGVAYNPVNDHIFLTDDVAKKVFDVYAGADGIYGTNDDVYSSFSTLVFGSSDPSGISFDSSTDYLYIVDGEGKRVYHVDQNGGIITSFDISHAGVKDPEGIAYSPACGNLFIADDSDYVVEMTSDGEVIRLIDISAANPVWPAGITLAPKSSPPKNAVNIYVADRGVDNDDHPNENDGKVYEFSFPALTDCNTPPEVNAGLDQFITGPFPAIANLTGTATDDGLPDPPGNVTTNWSQVSGPHPVKFGNPSALVTTASFPEPGVYVLRLTADDGELAPSDEVTITVTSATGVVIESTVNASSDDAEEKASNTQVSVTSLDLDLVYDSGQSQNQTVGIRFNGIGIPKNATIVNAYIQFYARNTTAGGVSITIKGEDEDNAETFASINGNITSRNTTTASVVWSPGAWVDGKRGFEQRTSNLAPIVQEIVGRGGWSSCNSIAFIFSGSGERVAESFDGWQINAPILHIYVDSGTTPVNQGPCVNAGPDQTVAAAGNLDGTVIDDGLPDPPGVVNATWSMTSGPGTVLFGNASAVDTTAIFSVAGTYVLRLTANDGQLNSYDEVTITATEATSLLYLPIIN
jgi:hypothetical protein